MRSLAISLILVFASCALKTTEDLLAVPVSEKMVKNPYFSNIDQDYIYKAKIDVYGRSFGGIFIVKKLGSKSHRIVFTTEFGNTLFDFTLAESDFNVNYILPEINKPLILKTLETDFRILLLEEADVLNQYIKGDNFVYKTENDKKFNFYFFEDFKLNKIVNTSKTKEKLIISFSEIEAETAQKISLEHQNIKLSIQLDFLNQIKNVD